MPIYKYRRPKLYDYQIRCLFGPERLAATEACTKVGKTHGALAWQHEQCWLRVGDHWWVAVTHAVAQIAYRRAKRAFARTNVPIRTNENNQTITFPNKSVWWFKTAEKPDNLFGEDVHSIVIDEAGRCREAAYTACTTTMTYTEGPMRLIGNLHGVTWYYQMCRDIEAGALPGTYHRMDWRDGVRAGVIKQRAVDHARATLIPAEFSQLYDVILPDADMMFNPVKAQYIEPDIDVAGNAVRFWDLAATEVKPGEDPDYTVGLLLLRMENGSYLIEDVIRDRRNPGGVEALIQATAILDGKNVLVGVEQEPGSSGKFAVNTLTRTVLDGVPFRTIRPTGKKHERARPISAHWEHGNVFMRRAPWNRQFIEEAAYFPQGRHDDQVDALSGAHSLIANHGEVTYPQEG